MDISRQELGRAKKREELLEQLEAKAAELDMGAAQGQNAHGPVYVSSFFDLRIEKDPGYGEYKLMLMQKLQPPPSLAQRLRGLLGGIKRG